MIDAKAQYNTAKKCAKTVVASAMKDAGWRSWKLIKIRGRFLK